MASITHVCLGSWLNYTLSRVHDIMYFCDNTDIKTKQSVCTHKMSMGVYA